MNKPTHISKCVTFRDDQLDTLQTMSWERDESFSQTLRRVITAGLAAMKAET